MVSRAQNRYCTTCLQTKRFFEVGDTLVCECCRKLLHKVSARQGLSPND